jgi:hypothetical protein
MLVFLADSRKPTADISPVVAPRIELSATASSGPTGQPVLDYQVFFASARTPIANGDGEFFKRLQAKEKRPGVAFDTGPIFQLKLWLIKRLDQVS